MNRSRTYGLDYLRGLSALFVVYAHLFVVAAFNVPALAKIISPEAQGPLIPELAPFRLIDILSYRFFQTSLR